jgi:hypothetical protein
MSGALMRTKIYEITDQHILERFFGPDALERPVASLGQDHGKLIFSGGMDHHPDSGDALLVDGDHPSVNEYIVICRLYHADKNSVTLIVHPREYTKQEILS